MGSGGELLDSEFSEDSDSNGESRSDEFCNDVIFPPTAFVGGKNIVYVETRGIILT